MALIAVLLLLGQAWSARDGVIRFPFVHWWMYSGPFDAPDRVVLHGYAVRGDAVGGKADPGLDTAPLKARESLDLALDRHAQGGHQSAGSVQWIEARWMPLLYRCFSPVRAEAWRQRMVPDSGTIGSAQRAALLEAYGQRWLWAGGQPARLVPVDTVLFLQPGGAYAGNQPDGAHAGSRLPANAKPEEHP
jgi:hypothetical protein